MAYMAAHACLKSDLPRTDDSGRLVRWCWVNFQCRGFLLIRIIEGQGLTARAVGAGGGCLDIFFSSIISLRSPSLGDGPI